TPVAVIQSSLDNLEQPGLNAIEQQTYVGRARDGLTRLASILTAMSEASRVEESLRSANPQSFDLVALLQDVSAAYQGAYSQHTIKLNCTESAATLFGSPELLVQALDKLVENAASFSNTGDTIVIGLDREPQTWLLSVSNRGPLLPADLKEHLFEPMVSLRTGNRPEEMHLGLGLHVVRLVAESFGGYGRAEDLEDGSGVRFTIVMPDV
ncbi:MAG: ATP-binding protein, partial [Halieaceae bacterium]